METAEKVDDMYTSINYNTSSAPLSEPKLGQIKGISSGRISHVVPGHDGQFRGVPDCVQIISSVRSGFLSKPNESFHNIVPRRNQIFTL
jgi:hypothetical protein